MAVDAGPPIVDVDAHYTDHFEPVVEYLDEDDPWRERFAIGSRQEGTDGPISMFPKITGSKRSLVHRHDRSAETREDVIDIMEFLGVDDIILFSNQVLLFGIMSQGDKRQTKFANAYTDFMLDRIADADEGVHISIPIPLDNTDEAAALIERTAHEDAVAAGCVITGRTEPPVGHRRYDTIYDAAERTGLPLTFHGASAFLDEFYVSGFSGKFEPHALGFIWDNMAAITSLLAEGVPEKYPDLDMVFLESGLFYIPMLMYRLDMEYLRQEWESPLLERRPSAYMKEFYYGTQPMEVVPDPTYFEYVIEMLGGPERLMFCTDYPHTDYDNPSVIEEMRFLTDDEQAAVLGGTAHRVFDL